jgi:hypothetical protein
LFSLAKNSSKKSLDFFAKWSIELGKRHYKEAPMKGYVYIPRKILPRMGKRAGRCEQRTLKRALG